MIQVNPRLGINTVFFINGWLLANWSSRIPEIQSHYGLAYSQMGWVLLSAALGSLIGMPTAGYLFTRYASDRLTRWSLLAYVVSVPAFMLSSSLMILMTLFFVMGLSVGIMDVAMNEQAVRIEKLYSRPIMSFFHAMFSAGMMLGAITGMGMEWLQVSLRVDFVSVSIVALGIVALVWTRMLPVDVPVTEGREPYLLIPHRSLVVIGLIAFCCMLGEGAMADWSTSYMLHVGGATGSWAPISLMAFSMAMMVGRLLGDAARERLGDRLLMVYTSTIATIGMVLAVALPYPVAIVAGMGLVGIGLSVIVPIAYSQAGASPHVDTGPGIAMVTTIGYSGFLLGPPLIGMISEQAGMRGGYGFVLIIFVIMMLLVISQLRR